MENEILIKVDEHVARLLLDALKTKVILSKGIEEEEFFSAYEIINEQIRKQC